MKKITALVGLPAGSVALLILAVTGAVHAQSPAAPQAGPPAQPAAPPAGTAPAFVVQSDDGDNRLQLGALLHADTRAGLGARQGAVTDAFQLRRFRAISQGRVARHFEFFLNAEFAGNLTIRDGFIDTVFSPAFRVRVGKARVPFSYDRNILIVNLPFVERGLTTAVAPDRDVGFTVLGDLAGAVLSYGASITNGSVDGASPDVDTNDSKDVAGRLILRPWVRHPARLLGGLGVAFAANTGVQGTGLPSFVTGGRQTFFAYAPGVVGDGRRTRWSPQVFYHQGPFGGYGEFVRSRGGVARGTDVGDVDHDVWQVAASWVLTGEPAVPERNVRPRVSFNPATRDFGALQVTARVQRLSVGREAFVRELTAVNASRRADVLTLGANWYPNAFIKWLLNFERTVFDDGAAGARPAENVILLRAQLGF